MSWSVCVSNSDFIMHWEQYWNSTDGFSSFAELKNEFGYPKEILHFWQKTLSEISSENLKVLDLATGKGALAIWLKAAANSQNKLVDIYACDAADIDVSSIKSNDEKLEKIIKDINFSFATNLEQLPYEDDCFDLLVSQFGFEYSSWESSLKEVTRVLKPGGQAVFMMHSASSQIALNSAAGLSVFKSLVELELFEKLKTLVDLKLTNQQLEFTNKNKQLIKSLNEFSLDNNSLQWFQDVVSNVAKIMQNINSESHTAIDKLQTNVEFQIKRLEEQTRVSMTENSIRSAFDEASLELKIKSINSMSVDEEHFAWTVVIE